MPFAPMNFDNNFKITNTALRIIGSHPTCTRHRYWKVKFTLLILFKILSFSALCYSIFIKDLQDGRYDDASKNAVMLLMTMTVIFEYSILLIHQQSIMSVINTMNEDYELIRELTEKEKKIVLDYSEKGRTVGRIFYIASVLCCMIFPLKAVLLMVYIYFKKGTFQLVPVFDLTYPGWVEKIKSQPGVYVILLSLYSLFAFYVTTTFTGFDPLVPIFLLHSCGQLDVVSQRILTLYFETSNEEQLEEKLRSIILKLQEIYSFVDVINNDFTILYEFTMTSTTFVLPLCAFQILMNFRDRDTNFEFIPFFFGIILHFYMPCYYSNLLMEKSENLRQAIYSCGWELQPNLRTRKTVLIMLIRATRPLVIHSIFYPICLDTFAKMARTAYAIFNIMTTII